MSCQHCAMAVTRALSALDGIQNVQVDWKAGVVTYDEAKPVDEKIVAASIKNEGYDIV